MDKSNLTRDPQRTLYLRERGLSHVRWQATLATAGMITGAVGCVVPIVFVITSTAEAPVLAVAGLIAFGMGSACYEAWRLRRRRMGEIITIESITPLVEAWRAGLEISHHDRDTLHQVKEMLFAITARYRQEADTWRARGREEKGAALTALLRDLEQAKSLVDEGFGKGEREIRPNPSGHLEVAAAPLDSGREYKTGLED